MAYKVVYTAKEFHDLLIHIAVDLKTYYNNAFPYNLGYHYKDGSFSFDCWNLIKAIIWGWTENIPVNSYRGCNASTGLGDWGGAKILSCCTEVSSNWAKAPVGAFMLSPKGDHAGIYIGERIINSKCYNVVECTPKWNGGVQLSYVSLTGDRYPYKGGAKASVGWGKFGKLPWIDYSEEPTPPTPPTPTPEEPIYYTVKRGDALYKIANAYKTTIAKLVEWNNIKNPNLIYVGQKLIVGYKNPEPQPPEPEKVYYTVKKGDNLTRIAEKYGTTVQQIVEWNKIANPNLIYPGQVLRVR